MLSGVRLISSSLLIFASALVFGDSSEPEPVDDPLTLEADSPIVYTDKNQTLLAQGNATLKNSKLLLLGEKITWNRELNQVKASGNVSLNYLQYRILADRLTFFVDSGDYFAEKVRGGSGLLFFEAQSIQKTGNILDLNQSTLHYHEPDPLGLNLASEFLSRDLNNSATEGRSIQLKVGNFTIGKLPHFKGKYNPDRLPYRPKIGFGKEGDLGWYSELGLTYASQNATKSGSVKIFNNKGLLLSPSYEWHLQTTGGFTHGILAGSWISQKNSPTEYDLRGKQVPSERGHVQFSSINRYKDHWRLASVIDWESDSEFKRDFFRESFARKQWNKSFAEISYDNEWSNLTVFSEWQSNRHESITQSLPLISIQSGPIPFAKAYHTTSLNFSVLKSVNEFGRADPQVKRLDLGYKIEKPIRLHQGIVFTPSWDIRHRTNRSDKVNFDHSIGGVGADLNIQLHKVFKMQPITLLDFDQVTHLTNFSLAYRNKNSLSKASENHLPVRPSVDNFNYESIDLLDHSESEWFEPYHIFRAGWSNSFSGHRQESTHRLINSRIYADLAGKMPELTRRSRFLYSEIEVTPWPWLVITHSNKYDLSLNEYYKESSTVRLIDGRFQELSIRYSKYFNFNDFAEFSAWKRINEKTLLSMLGRYDLNSKQASLLGASINYLTSGNWSVELSVNKRKGTIGDNSTEWRLGASLAAF